MSSLNKLIAILIGIFSAYFGYIRNIYAFTVLTYNTKHAATGEFFFPGAYTMRSLIKWNVSGNSRLAAGTACLTAKRYK